MTDQEFGRAADAALESLYARLAGLSDDFEFDVDFNGGALTVEFEEPRERFVVSPNAPVRQIWVSAHVQSYKLDWTGREFRLGSGQTLDELMADAIAKRIPGFAL